MDPTWERRPTSETPPAPTKKLSTNDTSGDARHEGFNAGYALGKMERFELEVKDAVQAALHAEALVHLGFARRLAGAKGKAWQALIVWSGEADE